MQDPENLRVHHKAQHFLNYYSYSMATTVYCILGQCFHKCFSGLATHLLKLCKHLELSLHTCKAS